MSRAVIVFSFPEPEDKITLGYIIEQAKETFVNMQDLTVHLAVNQSAERINAILKGEFDEKLMRRAVAGTKLEVVLPQEESEREGD